MSASFHINIVLPSRIAYEGEIASLVVPAQEGYLGVLAHHAPLIAQLKPGAITLRDSLGKIITFYLKSSGFIEVSENRATLILDSLELPS